MDVTNSLLVAMMFIVLLTMAIGSLIMALATLEPSGVRVHESDLVYAVGAA